MDMLANADIPGFTPGSFYNPDVIFTSTLMVKSCQTTRLGVDTHPGPDVLRVHAGIDSGGQIPPGDDPHGSIRDTDGDR